MLADDYLMSLSPKKREKALLSNSMYQKILMVLLQPKNTQVSTAQFRFWARKMFTMSTTETHHVVCHAGKPVATKECLYDVLVYCHRKSSHGGRDKTSAEMRDLERVDPSTSNSQYVYQSDQQQAHQQHRQHPQNQLYWSAPQASLQQHHGARLYSEHMYRLQQQRAQHDLIGRSCPNLQYAQHSHQADPSVQPLAQQSASHRQYFGMNSGASSASILESYRAQRWNEAVGGQDSLITDDNEALAEDEGRWYIQQNGLSWSNEGARSAVHPDHAMDDDCTPSGLAGIAQEVRRFDRRNVSRVPGAQQHLPSQRPQQGPGFQLRPAHSLYEPLHQDQPMDQGSHDPAEGGFREMEGRVYYDRLPSQGEILHALGQSVHPSSSAQSFNSYTGHSNAPHVSALQGSRHPSHDRFRQAPSAFASSNVEDLHHHRDTRDDTREIRGQDNPSYQSKHEDNEVESSEMT
ncbi:hypothetical protein BGZ70_008114 [Mortierella alpina]|uniref:Uncharacterized protein n=1 Tax=Mortierella alpina TaxID=64518 RepID=A0A9P6JDN4_MORAP|nr:hypothetical protein BGZ70_008114 [Mortierella alpina]